MTTTPATTFASPSTPRDSPIEDDNNGASQEMSVDDDQPPPEKQTPSQQQPQPPPPPTPPPPAQQQQQQQQQNQQRHQKLQPQQQSSKQQQPQTNTSTTIEQKRPMNAFLLFCKKQRSSVREKYPNLENRGITRILGDWWTKLDKEQKSKYTDLARQHKEAFMEANPDFKWCRTPNTTATTTSATATTSSSNNNNNSNSATTTNYGDCYASTNNRSSSNSSNNQQESSSSSLSPASTDLHQASNIRDTTTFNSNKTTSAPNNRPHHPQQHEAPKPPKKRYLERNDPVYNNLKNNSIKNNDDSLHTNSTNTKDHIVPYMQLDQVTLGRVIEKALSEKSNDSPTGLNMCKDSNRNNSSNNLTSALGVEPNPFITSTSTMANAAPSTNSMSLYSNGDDEPVDFSMKVTFRATNQLIIDNVVEKAYSGSLDISSGTSRSGGTNSNVHSHLGSTIRGVNTEET